MRNVYVQKEERYININLLLHLLMAKENIKTIKTKVEAIEAGIKTLNEYINVGHCMESSNVPYGDYLDYWIKEHYEINLKYHTI